MIHRGRGRPRQARDAQGGTPETLRKWQSGETAAALDNLLQRGLLTPGQHWAGLHLRRLHHGLMPVRRMASGFYWVPPVSLQPVKEATLQRWREEYHAAEAGLRRDGVWKETLALVCADGGVSPPILQAGCHGCVVLEKTWCGEDADFIESASEIDESTAALL